jgi:hypothetical protein
MAWYPQLSFSLMVTVSRKSVVEDRSVNTAFLIHEPTPTTHRFRRRLLARLRHPDGPGECLLIG